MAGDAAAQRRAQLRSRCAKGQQGQAGIQQRAQALRDVDVCGADEHDAPRLGRDHGLTRVGHHAEHACAADALEHRHALAAARGCHQYLPLHHGCFLLASGVKCARCARFPGKARRLFCTHYTTGGAARKSPAGPQTGAAGRLLQHVYFFYLPSTRLTGSMGSGCTGPRYLQASDRIWL